MSFRQVSSQKKDRLSKLKTQNKDICSPLLVYIAAIILIYKAFFKREFLVEFQAYVPDISAIEGRKRGRKKVGIISTV